jgi:uncharacterized protein
MKPLFLGVVMMLCVAKVGIGPVANVGAGDPQGPSYDCSQAEVGSIEALICEDEALSLLDRQLADVYAEATVKSINAHPPTLKAEQRGWIKGRNECWKSENQQSCVRDAYRLRIAELQARYRLVPSIGPIFYTCDGEPTNEVIATFFRTDPPTLVAERGDQVSLMVLQPSASGSNYQGGNASLWEHGGEAIIVWGYGSPEMRCTKKPSPSQ